MSDLLTRAKNGEFCHPYPARCAPDDCPSNIIMDTLAELSDARKVVEALLLDPTTTPERQLLMKYHGLHYMNCVPCRRALDEYLVKVRGKPEK